MNLNSITAELLEETLKAWRNYQKPPSGLLNLSLLGSSNSDSLAERDILLRERLEKLAFETLMRHRQSSSKSIPHSIKAPTSAKEVRQDLAIDFNSGNPDLEAWSAIYHQYLISPEFNLSVGDLAEAAMPKMAKDKQGQYRRRVKEGLNRLAVALQQAEFRARQRPRELPLPVPEYTTLFGVDEIVEQIYSWLKSPTDCGPLFISIEALGGWGKTAIARAVAGKFLKSGLFADIVWISARHEELNDAGQIRLLKDPVRSTDDIITHLSERFVSGNSSGLSRANKIERLLSILQDKSCLIIIDNLETLNDIEELIPALFPLAGKTRFLLTSRAPLGEFDYVQCLRVPEMSLSNSKLLIQSELRRGSRQAFLAENDMEKIYELIGGVPLALKLVASQMKHLPLMRILDGLREARQRAPEAIFTYIYRRTWQELLDEPARLLLLSLQHIPPEGEDEAWIRENSLLSESDFEFALKKLQDCSLLELTGPLDAPLYHLHRLTITFLQTEILLGWQEQETPTN